MWQTPSGGLIKSILTYKFSQFHSETFLEFSDTAHLDIIISPVASDSGLPLQLGRQLQLGCNIYTEPAVDLRACGWLYNDQPFYLFNNHKYIVYYTPSAGKSTQLLYHRSTLVKKKKLLAFSFANFEKTRGSTGKANTLFLSLLSFSINLHERKKVTPQFSKKSC